MADIALAGQLFASHYAEPARCALAVEASALFAGPSPTARAVSQLVRGEEFLVLDIVGGWAWGRSAHDGYVGYLPADRLGHRTAATHRIAVPLALVFAEADIKAPVVARWPLGARFEGTEAGAFLSTDAGFVHRRHASALGETIEATALAERMLGQPYLWGGRGGGGIDCSGLVQVGLAFAGISAPRDSDLQRDEIGESLPEDVPLRRGDLIFFPGHVGLMADAARLIHANAYAMAVTIEPLAAVVERLKPDHMAPIVARRRVG